MDCHVCIRRKCTTINNMHGKNKLYIFLDSESKKKLLLKTSIANGENFRNNEYKMIQIVYNKLHEILPHNVIKPIKHIICKSSQMQKEMRFPNHRYVCLCVYDLVGDESLAELNDSIKNQPTFDYSTSNHAISYASMMEILFQILLFIIKLKKHTDVVYTDFKLEHIMLKRNIDNEMIECYVLNKDYEMTPKYLAYLIDYKSAYRGKSNDTWRKLWDVLNEVVLFRDFYHDNLSRSTDSNIDLLNRLYISTIPMLKKNNKIFYLK
jgi:hypothetical protein